MPRQSRPEYYENNLVSFGDPAVAVGPRPVAGRFSWANGSRMYYANLTATFDAVLEAEAPSTVLGVAVSRLDNPTAARVTQKNNWQPPVIAIGRGGTSGACRTPSPQASTVTLTWHPKGNGGLSRRSTMTGDASGVAGEFSPARRGSSMAGVPDGAELLRRVGSLPGVAPTRWT